MEDHRVTVFLPLTDVWEIVNLYDSMRKDSGTSSAVLEALSYLFIDTPIGEEIGSIWLNRKGAKNE